MIIKLTNDRFKREYCNQNIKHQQFTRSALSLPAEIYSSYVVPLIEISSDISSSNEEIRLNYEKQTINDINYALHIRPLGPIYIKPSPKCSPVVLGEFFMKNFPKKNQDPVFVIEVDLINKDHYKLLNSLEDSEVKAPSSWNYWHEIHRVTEFSTNMEVALVLSSDSCDDADEVTRWLGECINMIVVDKSCFMTNSNNYPIFTKQNQDVFRLFSRCCRSSFVLEMDNIENKIFCHYGDYISFQENSIKYDEHSLEPDSPRFVSKLLLLNIYNFSSFFLASPAAQG